MPEVTQKVELITHTPLPETVAALGAKLCYSSSGIDDLKEIMSPEKSAAFIQKIVDNGHLSVIEHAGFTFGIEGVSRSLLAQITRHRIASFSVQSQRYVSYSDKGFGYIIPPAIRALGPEKVERFEHQMNMIQRWYTEWQNELGNNGESSNEDARFVLPNACETRMLVTMNARELLHFFELRCCNRAQWEIRELAWKMLALARKAAPALFGNAGPACIRGGCPEGKMSCGRAQEVRARQQKIMSEAASG